MTTTEISHNSVTLNGIEYVRKDTLKSETVKYLDGKPYVIIRTYSAGVFAGFLESRIGKEAVLLHARRLWYWAGAASLSQLASEGTKKPNDCKFPCEVSRVELMEAIEVLETTKKAMLSIKSVKIWEM